jgi:hypothetical protein
VVGECDLFVSWHTAVIADITQMTEICVISDYGHEPACAHSSSLIRPTGK